MSTSHPPISAVIPACNAESCLARAIESVFSQTHPVSEIIVVDDGSRDATSDIVRSFGDPVRLVRQSNAGPSAARNHGIRLARSEWIALLDADDAWLPEKLERQLPYLAETGVGAVHCPTDTCLAECEYEGELTFEMLWTHNMIGTSTVLLRKSAWEDVGGFDEDRELTCVEDYNLWLRLLLAGWRIRRCPERLAVYSPEAGNLSSQTHRVIRAELLNARRVAEVAGLAGAALRSKESRIHGEYGQSLVHSRDMRSARRHLTQAMMRRPTRLHAKYWLATLVPPSLLNWRRERRRQPQESPAVVEAVQSSGASPAASERNSP
ncbi:MAG: glycosyltransferase family 2 protein [Planctomycetota bacterium]|nr:MAG: glycosyltransferase family 2 protein [Planctomycetota bacterium]REJ93402.1 MAG: glycosyltransferase family 2 protein [Planctomycetota bacterium]REK20779.1 MAG: glycosyltransferase family 2 protein [Planctomycetota bacterium]REK38039.1 MAG: glycosyltransferase family 2 protein [Planctomycetota bacterium]